MSADRPLRIAIDRVTVSAASGLEARRLADALPGALERSMRRMMAGSPPMGAGLRSSPADRAADQVAAAVAERLGALR